MKKYILPALFAFSLVFSLAFAPKVEAAGLTSTQISAIIGLLQSFGADQSVITNVQNALGGGPSSGVISAVDTVTEYTKTDYNIGAGNNLSPWAIGYLGNYIWVASGTSLIKVDSSTGAVAARYSGFGYIGAIAVDPSTSSLWIGDLAANTVTRVDGQTGARGASYTLPTGSCSQYLAFDTFTNSVWATCNTTGGPIVRVNVATGVTTSFNSGVAGSGNVTFDSSTQSVWVPSTSPATLFKVNPETGTKISFLMSSAPDAIVFDSGTNSIWVATAEGNIVKRNSSTGDVIGTYPIGVRPETLAYDRSSSSIWATSLSGSSVTKISAATGAKIGTYTVTNASAAVAGPAGSPNRNLQCASVL